MARKFATARTFAGVGYVARVEGAQTLVFTWRGEPDGTARYVPHVRRYVRNGVEHKSLRALMKAVAAEHRS